MPTIRKRSDTYQIRVSAGYDGAGKQLIQSMTWRPAPGMTPKQVKKELDRQSVLFEEKVKNGQMADGAIKFSVFADLWFKEHAEKQLAAKTTHEYHKLWKRIEPAVGNLRLDKLQPIHFQRLYSNLAEAGMNLKTGGVLSPSTIKHYHAMLSSMLNMAVLWGYLPISPLRVRPPKQGSKQGRYLDETQVLALLAALEDEPIQYKSMIYALIYTGMRKGELLGLEWNDLDFNNQLIHIERASQYIPRQGVITKEPKNKTSQRVIKAPSALFDMLSALKQNQLVLRMQAGDQWQDTGRLFTRWNGAALHPDTLPKWFRRFLRRYDLPYINIHGLRHTNASLLIAEHVDIRTVAGRLGHANTSTTLNLYAHQLQSADVAASDALEIALALKPG